MTIILTSPKSNVNTSKKSQKSTFPELWKLMKGLQQSKDCVLRGEKTAEFP